MAIDGPMIVTNTFAASCNNDPIGAADKGTPCAVVSKRIECVYNVTVNFGTSTVSLETGPPGAVADKSSHRWWTFGVNGKSVAYNRGDVGIKDDTKLPDAPPKSGGSPTGTLGANEKFSTKLPHGYGAACADVSQMMDDTKKQMSASLLPYNYTAASGSKLWLQPNAITFGPGVGPNTDTQTALVFCLTQSAGTTALVVDPAASRANALKPVFALTYVDQASPSCLVVQQNLGVGVMQLTKASSACSAISSSSLPKWDVTVSANFPNWTAPEPAAGAVAPPPPPPTELKSMPVVTYSLPLGGVSGAWSALDLADPCTGVPLRLAAAVALAAKVPGFSATGLSMATISDPDGVTTITLAPDSPVNTLSAAPANCKDGKSQTARRLGMMLRREGGAARMLPAGSGGVSMVAQVPAGQQSSDMAKTVSSSAAPALPGLSSLAGATANPPQNAAPAKLVVALPITYAPRKNPYVVDPLIKEFHNLPRVCLVGCVGKATNSFATTTTYAQGAVGIAAGLFALAVISLIIYSISYCCGLCACASCRCRKARDPATLRYICAPRTVYIVFGIINIGLLLATLSYLGRFPTGLGQLVDGLNYFAGNFTVAGQYLANEPCGETVLPSTSSTLGTLTTCGVKSFDFTSFTSGDFKALGIDPAPSDEAKKPHAIRSIFASAKVAMAEVVTLKAACAADSNCPSAVSNIMDAISTGEDAAQGMTGSFGPLMTSVGKMITDALGSLNISTYKQQIALGGYAVMGLLAGFIAIYTFFVCKNTCACCIHGISSAFTIVLVTILMIITGIFYAVGVIGADICYDPNATLMTLASGYMPAGGMAGDTLSYYLTCGANPATKAIGAVSMIGGMIGTVQGAAAQVQSLAKQSQDQNNHIPLGSLGTATPDFTGASGSLAMTSLSQHIGYSADAVTSLAGVMSCATMDPILSTLWTGACTNGVATIIGISRILIAACVLLFIQLGVGIDMCCFHPGLTSRYWAEEGVDPEGDGAGATGPAGHPKVLASSV